MSTHLIAGCGYLGRRVARRWLMSDQNVAAITRSEDRADTLAAEGIQPVIADVTQADTLRELPPAKLVLFAVGYDRSAGMAIDEVYVDGLAHLLAALTQPPERFIYISSTGVFGQTDGSWVNEDSECRPSRAGGKACLAAERLLLESNIADRVVILRCAGLYGPGRIPRLDYVAAGKPFAANPHAWLNLIHIEDATNIVVDVGSRELPSQLYLVSDGHPVQRRDFYEYLAKRHDLPPPQFEPSAAEEESRRAGGDNKRIDNRRLMQELQPTLNFPTYREGLDAIET